MKKILMFALFGMLAASCAVSKQPDGIYGSGFIESGEINVGTKITGRVKKIYFEEGSLVKKGDLLFILDDYDQAKVDYERARKLKADNITTQEQLEKIEKLLQNCEVRSPIDGRLVQIILKEGEISTPQGAVLSIRDPQDVSAKIYVATADIGKVKIGSPANVTVDAFQNKKFDGKVNFIAQEAEFIPKNIQTKDERRYSW
jgi:multidrug efflux pump subunit AcrA (membrane-fusion protein)